MTFFPQARSRCTQLVAALMLASAPFLAHTENAMLPEADAPTATDTPQFIGELSSIPAPNLPARAWLSVDASTGQLIAAKDLEEQIEPASLTKLMTAYLVFDALERGSLTLDQTVRISPNAWRTGGSRMYIEPDTNVSVDDLLKGVIVQSGNDATVALAEAVAGSEAAFVALMNEEATRQGLTQTHFENSSGLPHPDHLTSVRDLGILAQNLVNDFPQYLPYYSQKEFTYNNIRQPNRNRLLSLDPTVDGLKTGHTDAAGYCLVSTALRDGRRVVAVVVGTANDNVRTESSLELLNWSYKNFEMVELFGADDPVLTAQVWEGEEDTVGLGVEQPLRVTVPRGKTDQIEPIAEYSQPLIAPIEAGTVVGQLSLKLGDTVLVTEPLVALKTVPQAGFFGRMYDKVRMWFN